MRFFATQSTLATLQTQPVVFLIGGDLGYKNFGDTLQLKSTVMFYLENTQLTPVLVMALNRFNSIHDLESLAANHRTDKFIFFTDDGYESPIDPAESRLKPVDQVAGASTHLLHVYGGGYFVGTNHWVESMTHRIATFIEHFSITRYLLSGGQLDEAGAPFVGKLLHEHRPLLFGLRDEESLRIARSHLPQYKPQFSFDDVTELMLRWVGKRRARRSPHDVTEGIAWHIGMTDYTGSQNEAESIVADIVSAKDMYPTLAPIVIQAFDEPSHIAMDSLQSIVQLAGGFPYSDYRVVNLSRMAVDIDHTTNVWPDVAKSLSGVRLAVVSSYHSAMLLILLRVPVYLRAKNDYYESKQQALRLAFPYEDFIADPARFLVDLSDLIRRRKSWMGSLRRTLRREGFYVKSRWRS